MLRMSRSLATVVASAILLSACATTGDGNGQTLTPEEQRLRQEADVYNQTLLEGGLVGCGVGMLSGFLIGGNAKSAAIGCGVGAAGGLIAGNYIADKQQKYASQEQQYDSMIADVRKDNQNLAAIITDSQKVIANDRQRIEQIDHDLAAGKITMDQAKARMAAVDENSKYLSGTLDTLKKKKEMYAEAMDKTQGSRRQQAAMDREITKLDGQIAQLQGDLDSLVHRRHVSRVG